MARSKNHQKSRKSLEERLELVRLRRMEAEVAEQQCSEFDPIDLDLTGPIGQVSTPATNLGRRIWLDEQELVILLLPETAHVGPAWH